MACVGGLVTEASSGEHCAQGSAVLSHDSVLCGGGVRFEQLTVVKILGVLHISCRVMLGNVERLEAVEIVNYLEIVLNVKAH